MKYFAFIFIASLGFACENSLQTPDNSPDYSGVGTAEVKTVSTSSEGDPRARGSATEAEGSATEDQRALAENSAVSGETGEDLRPLQAEVEDLRPLQAEVEDQSLEEASSSKQKYSIKSRILSSTSVLSLTTLSVILVVLQVSEGIRTYTNWIW